MDKHIDLKKYCERFTVRHDLKPNINPELHWYHDLSRYVLRSTKTALGVTAGLLAGLSAIAR